MSEVWRRYIHTAVEAQLRETETERERATSAVVDKSQRSKALK